MLDPWPFSVDRVELSCEAGRVFVTAPDGRRFGANGSARALAPGTEPIQSHYDTRQVIARGLALCADRSGPVVLRAPPARTPPNDGGGRAGPGVAIVPEPGLNWVFVTIESDEAAPAGRAELTFVCKDGEPPTIQINMRVAPNWPPPLAGTYGTLSHAGRVKRIELAWLPEAMWSPRDPRAVRSADVLRDLLRGEDVRFDPPAGYGYSGPRSWSARTIAARREDVRRQCL